MSANPRKHVRARAFRSQSAAKSVRKGARNSGKQAQTAQDPNGEDPSSDPRKAFAEAMRETAAHAEAGDLEAARGAFGRALILRREIDALEPGDAPPEVERS